MKENKALYLYYDGLCKVCSKEVAYYKKLDTENVLGLIDISASNFDLDKEGLSQRDVNKYFHVKRKNGEILAGVKAFQAIWDELNILQPLSKVSKTSLGHSIMNVGYQGFVKLRPFLPKNKTC